MPGVVGTKMNPTIESAVSERRKREREQQKRSNRHDRLCLEHPDHGDTGPTQYCWCNCPNCWSNQGSTAPRRRQTSREREADVTPPATQRKPKGQCICRACPCHDIMGLPTAISFVMPSIMQHGNNR